MIKVLYPKCGMVSGSFVTLGKNGRNRMFVVFLFAQIVVGPSVIYVSFLFTHLAFCRMQFVASASVPGLICSTAPYVDSFLLKGSLAFRLAAFTRLVLLLFAFLQNARSQLPWCYYEILYEPD